MARLTFAEKHGFYSTYKTRNGVEVHLHDRTYERLFAVADLDIRKLFNDWQYTSEAQNNRPRNHLQLFRDHLAPRVIDPKNLDEILQCPDCLQIKRPDECTTDAEGRTVCATCIKTYYATCTDCDKPTRYQRYTEDGRRVCTSCADRDYTYCERCDRYYNPETTDNSHRHDGSDCCSVPEEATTFFIPNDGNPPLVNDTMTTITLPAGDLSDEGVQAIARYLMDQRVTTIDPVAQRTWLTIGSRVHEIGPKWQAKEGNFTKRLSRWAYQQFGFKIPAEVISQVGNIGAMHSTATDFHLEVSRLLDQSAEEWGHPESCWWQSYFHSRCALKSNGGFGIRTKSEYGEVTGRTWVYPLKRTVDDPTTLRRHDTWLTPTFETTTPDAYVVFNGYGNLAGYAGSRVLAHMAGMTYRKVAMALGPNSYVNNDSAYLVAPEDIAQYYTDGTLSITAQQHATLFADEQAARVGRTMVDIAVNTDAARSALEVLVEQNRIVRHAVAENRIAINREDRMPF